MRNHKKQQRDTVGLLYSREQEYKKRRQRKTESTLGTERDQPTGTEDDDERRTSHTIRWTFVVLGCIFALIAVPTLIPYLNHQTRTCTVTDMWSKTVYKTTSTGQRRTPTQTEKVELRRVHTTCGVFSVDNMPLAGDFNGAKERFADIRRNKTYVFEVTGFQWGGAYPVVREVSAPLH